MNKNKVHDLYKNYTTTSVFTYEVDEKQILEWSKGYFIYHFNKFLPTNKNARILEVGCGYGRYIKVLSDLGYTETYGVDISTEQVNYGINVLGLKNIEEADAIHWLKDKNNEYDTILVLDVLEHLNISDLLELGKVMFKALKPGGSIIVQVPNGMAPLNSIVYDDLTHKRAFTVKSIEQFFLNIGLIPKGYYELPVYIHGVKSLLRRLVWEIIIKPFINVFLLILYGSKMKGIYTANFTAVAQRPISEEYGVTKCEV